MAAELSEDVLAEGETLAVQGGSGPTAYLKFALWMAEHHRPLIAAARTTRGCMLDIHEASQVLGKALGMPWYKDDQANFPGATDADGVCTGEHVLVTLADAIARRCRELESEAKRSTTE